MVSASVRKRRRTRTRSKELLLTGLIIMIKNPTLGKAKTRIAATMGDEAALAIYRRLLDHTRSLADQLTGEMQRYLYYSDFIDRDDDWDNDAYHKAIQYQGDLGQRLQDSVTSALASCEKVIVIGSDCIALTAEHIKEADRLLTDHDVVLGPTYDGGYYLIGLSQDTPEVFTDMPWSTEAVADITRSRVQQSGKRLAELEVLSDIDTQEDWEAYQNL